MTNRLLTSLFSLLFLSTATVAAADLLLEAQQLEAVFEDLDARVDACPGGNCAGKQQILDDFSAAEVDRAQVHADREALGTCSCALLDATIASIDALAASIADETRGWEETSSRVVARSPVVSAAPDTTAAVSSRRDTGDPIRPSAMQVPA